MGETSSGEGLSSVGPKGTLEKIIGADQGRYEPPPGSPEQVRELVERFIADHARLSLSELVGRMGEIYHSLELSLGREEVEQNFRQMAQWVAESKRQRNEAPGEENWRDRDDVEFREALVRRGYISQDRPSKKQRQLEVSKPAAKHRPMFPTP
ncbi:hypothetical protein HYT17_01790 [Candidatus Microgenomates bacterium]|nr:hypothetical protein [Candidatus Microgenomates bacterium]